MISAAVDNDTGDVSAAGDRRLWLATPLDTTRNSFRIMKLLKGNGTMPIICDISVESLDDNPFYEALSYVWGDDKITKDIIVRGVTISVTVNLFKFLSVLRSPTTDKLIWADAICIDQTNDKEKTHQIGLMTRIYRNCRKAHIWFDHFTPDWEQEASHSHDYRMTYEMTAPISWLLVMDCVRWLLTRPWWTRVWTLQEAVLPR
ncbi:HET-domain-containing protein, partial [Periconia macrospinosa]